MGGGQCQSRVGPKDFHVAPHYDGVSSISTFRRIPSKHSSFAETCARLEKKYWSDTGVFRHNDGPIKVPLNPQYESAVMVRGVSGVVPSIGGRTLVFNKAFPVQSFLLLFQSQGWNKGLCLGAWFWSILELWRVCVCINSFALKYVNIHQFFHWNT